MSSPGTTAAMGRVLLICNDSEPPFPALGRPVLNSGFPTKAKNNPQIFHFRAQSPTRTPQRVIQESACMSSPGTTAAMGRVLSICNDSAGIQQGAEVTQQFAIATEVCNESGR